MTKKESKILDFIINEIEVDEKFVKKFVSRTIIPAAVQEELLESYPETLLKISKEITFTESVTIQMIMSRNPHFLDVVVTKSLTEAEELALVEFAPERVKQYQDNINKENDCLLPETEEAYRKAQKLNPNLPDIDYIWTA